VTGERDGLIEIFQTLFTLNRQTAAMAREVQLARVYGNNHQKGLPVDYRSGYEQSPERYINHNIYQYINQ
jgi:hypothetical protein